MHPYRHPSPPTPRVATLPSGRLRVALAGLATALAALMAATPAAAAPSVWAVDDGEKVKRDATSLPFEQGVDNPVWAPGEAIKLFALRDETVAFQIIVDGDDSGLSDVTVDFDGLAGPDGAALQNAPGATDPTRFEGRRIERFVEHYFYIDRASGGPWPGSLGWEGGSPPDGDWTGWVPDALIPVEVAPSWAPYPMQVPAGQNRAVWIDVTVPTDQAPGLYQGEVVVAAGGQTVATLPVELEVHDQNLPAWPVKTMLYYNQANLNQSFGWDDAQIARKHLFQLLHRHRLTPMHSAYTADDAQALLPALDGSLYTAGEGYEGPAVGHGDDVLAMGVYGGYGDPGADDLSNVEAIADLLAAQGVIDDVDAFVYAIDESCGHWYGQAWKDLLASSSNATVQEHVEVGWTCSSEASSQAVDIVMKLASHFDPDETAAGKRIWAYNGIQPYSGSMLTDTDAVSLRVNGWLSGMFGVERWFYWAGTFWNDWNSGGLGMYDPFVESETFHNHWNEWANGDGVLLYPGKLASYPESDVGMNGIIASIRLKNWRRGIQDAGYLQLARARDAAAADAVAEALIPAALATATPEQAPSWSPRGEAFFRARADLAKLVGSGPVPEPPTPVEPTDPVEPEEPTAPDTADLTVLRTGEAGVVVDGDLGEFDGAPAVEIQAGDAVVTLHLLWDEDALYLGADVSDPSLHAPGTGDNGPLWTSDGVELLLDPLLTRTGTPDDDDRHVIMTAAGDLLDARGAGGVEDVSLDMGITRAVTVYGTLDDDLTDDGYTVELAIPWAGIGVDPAAGLVMGADLALNDATFSGFAYADWADLKLFAVPSAWRTIQLGELPVDGPPVVEPPVEEPPVDEEDPTDPVEIPPSDGGNAGHDAPAFDYADTVEPVAVTGCSGTGDSGGTTAAWVVLAALGLGYVRRRRLT